VLGGLVAVAGFNGLTTGSQTSNSDTFVDVTGADFSIVLEPEDGFLVAGQINAHSDTADDEIGLEIRVDRPNATVETYLSFQTNANTGATHRVSQCVTMFRLATQGAGLYRMRLAFNRQNGSGTVTKTRSHFVVLPFRNLAVYQAKNSGSGNQGSSLAPMGSGQDVLDERGPFAP